MGVEKEAMDKREEHCEISIWKKQLLHLWLPLLSCCPIGRSPSQDPFAAKDGEALYYSQQKEELELSMA